MKKWGVANGVKSIGKIPQTEKEETREVWIAWHAEVSCCWAERKEDKLVRESLSLYKFVKLLAMSFLISLIRQRGEIQASSQWGCWGRTGPGNGNYYRVLAGDGGRGRRIWRLNKMNRESGDRWGSGFGKDVILSWLGEVHFESEELSLLIVDGEQRSGHTLHGVNWRWGWVGHGKEFWV